MQPFQLALGLIVLFVLAVILLTRPDVTRRIIGGVLLASFFMLILVNYNVLSGNAQPMPAVEVIITENALETAQNAQASVRKVNEESATVLEFATTNSEPKLVVNDQRDERDIYNAQLDMWHSDCVYYFADVVDPKVGRWMDSICYSSLVWSVPPLIVASIMTYESGGNPNAVGAAGEKCLMQIMPFSDRPMALIESDPHECIHYGAWYLSWTTRLMQGDIWRGVIKYNGGGDAAVRYMNVVKGKHAAFFPLAQNRGFTQNYITLNIPSIPFQARKNGNIGSAVRNTVSSADFVPFSAIKVDNSMPKVEQHGRVSQDFGKKVSYQSCGFHTGIDFVGARNSPIFAMDDGVVVYVGPLWTVNARGNNNVVIEHDGGLWSTTYNHNQSVSVKAGDVVVAGQEIAKMGSEGYSIDGNGNVIINIGGNRGVVHLHLEAVTGKFSGDWRNPFVGSCSRYFKANAF